MIKFILLISAFSVTHVNLLAQLKLIPSPQLIELRPEEFNINGNTSLVPHDIDSFYMNQLMVAISDELNIDLGTSESSVQNAIEFIKPSSSEELTDILMDNELNSKFIFGEEGYVLSITATAIRIIAPTDAGIFYGIQTLTQIIKANRVENSIPCLIIYDKPDFAVRAWQDDVSRGPIPTMELLKEQVRKMASYKLNYFSLYIEHVFKLDKHPKIAPSDGLTKTQIRELSEYAKKYHVHLIGSYQSFGHMAKTLSVPEYQHLAENTHIISPKLRESYEFLDEVYEEIVPVFDGQYFNINCDETFGLGEGKSKEMMDTMGIDGVYIYHIDKLNTMLQKFNKKILMWGDIISKYPKTINKLPENITVMAWAYHGAESFDNLISPISSSGLNFWVAPGVNCWGNIYPNLEEAKVNIFNLMRDGKRNNATGVFNTTWDDDGLNFFHNNWHGLIWGAENSWKVGSVTNSAEQSSIELEERYSEFNTAFDPLFYGLQDEMLIHDIIEFAGMHRSGVRDVLRNGRLFEPIFPIHLEYLAEEKRMANVDALQQLTKLSEKVDFVADKVKNNIVTVDYLKFAIKQAQFTVRKNIFRVYLHDFMNGSAATSTQAKAERDELIQSIRTLKAEYAVLWSKENRPHWLDRNMLKFDNLIEDLERIEGHCIITNAEKLTAKGMQIAMSSLFGDLPVYYAINNDSVGRASSKFTEPIFITDDAQIKARVISKNQIYKPSEFSLIYHPAIGKLHKLNTDFSTYDPSYDGGGKYALLDGKVGTAENLKSGFWQGYGGDNIDIEIDLEEVQAINSFSMGFFQNTESWVIFPKKIEILVKDNLTDDYRLLSTIINEVPPEEKGNLKHEYKARFDDTKVRFVRVVAHYYGKLPEWHNAGSSYDSMIFADEVIIK